MLVCQAQSKRSLSHHTAHIYFINVTYQKQNKTETQDLLMYCWIETTIEALQRQGSGL